MADVFISYKSEDRAHAERVAKALESEGISVWWDPDLATGQDYQQVIDDNLRSALVVVVLWSKLSTRSRWVRSEATIGDRYGALAPVMIEACERPVAFELLQTADLSQWSGDIQAPAWREFLADVHDKLARRRQERAAPDAKPAPDQAAIEAIFWDSIQHSNDPADFRSYMRRYPKGHFFSLARNRLRSLKSGKTKGGVPWPVIATLIIVALGVGALLTRPYWDERIAEWFPAQPTPVVLEGRWVGDLTDADTPQAYQVIVDFARDQSGAPTAIISYPEARCSGAWTFMRRDAAQSIWVFEETIHARAHPDDCASGALVELTERSDGRVDFAWRYRADTEVSVRGVMARSAALNQ